MIALYDLAWQFGIADPNVLIDAMTESQLHRWLIYVGRVRDEERRADARAAAVIAAIFEANRNRKQRAKPYTARDFLPKYPDEQTVVTVVNRTTGASVPVRIARTQPAPSPSPAPIGEPYAVSPSLGAHAYSSPRPVLSAEESAARLVEQFKRVGARQRGRGNPDNQGGD